MRAFITGATGFIGSHLAEALHKKGYHLRCLARETSNLVWLQHLPVEFVYGDLFDQGLLKQYLTDADIVFHVAGVTKAKTKEEYFRSNHLATKHLLQVAVESRDHMKRFVHISSQAAVGPSYNGKPVNEQTPYHPITTYGVSKMEAEKECLRVMDKIPITIIRPPAVYGPRDKDVLEFFSTMNKGIQPMIGFHDKYVSLIHVHDLINGILLTAEHPKAVGETYFISSERFYNWKEVGEITARIMNKRALRIRIPLPAAYIVGALAEFFALFSNKPALLNLEKIKDIVQDAWTCDVMKAKRELGFKETVSIEQGIQETVAWYRQHGWLS